MKINIRATVLTTAALFMAFSTLVASNVAHALSIDNANGGHGDGSGDVALLVLDPSQKPRPRSIVWDLSTDDSDLTVRDFYGRAEGFTVRSDTLDAFLEDSRRPQSIKWQVVGISNEISGKTFVELQKKPAPAVGMLLTVKPEQPAYTRHFVRFSVHRQRLAYWLGYNNTAGMDEADTLIGFAGDPYYFLADDHQEVIGDTDATAKAGETIDFWHIQADPRVPFDAAYDLPPVNTKLGRFTLRIDEDKKATLVYEPIPIKAREMLESTPPQ